MSEPNADSAPKTEREKIAFCHVCRGRCDSCIMTAEGYRPAPNAEYVRCPRCGQYTHKATEAEALADCPERDYAAEKAEEAAHIDRSGAAEDVR